MKLDRSRFVVTWGQCGEGMDSGRAWGNVLEWYGAICVFGDSDVKFHLIIHFKWIKVYTWIM